MKNRHPLNRTFAIVAILFHLGAFTAPFFFTWQLLGLATLSWFLFGCVGICITYHRFLTHRGFKTWLWLEYLLALDGTLALEGDPIRWVARHRAHHRFSDILDKDPHTPRQGFWFAHLDWMLHPDPKFSTEAFFQRWTPDLLRHSFYRALRIWFWIPTTILGVGLLFLGGIPIVIWGLIVPIVAGWHFTWFINSLTHLWGTRRFPTNDDSRDNQLVAILTWGEGHHNSHHWRPTLARHGRLWWQWDPSWYTIWTMKEIGVFWDVKE